MEYNDVVIDADSLKYKAAYTPPGYAAPVSYNRCVTFKEEAEAIAFCTERDLKYYKTDFPNPLEFQLTALKRLVTSIIDATKAENPKLWLTGNSKAVVKNFRYGIATIQPYKGHRLLKPRPEYDDEMTEYLIKNFNAEIAYECEADDMCGIAGCNGSLICAIDKDVLYNIPGNKYNYDKGEFFTISEGDAWMHFFKQLLIGDQESDNIPGLKGIGEATAMKILNSVEDPTPQNLYDCVASTYLKELKREHPTRVLNRLHEVARLLWIKHKPRDEYYDYIEIKVD